MAAADVDALSKHQTLQLLQCAAKLGITDTETVGKLVRRMEWVSEDLTSREVPMLLWSLAALQDHLTTEDLHNAAAAALAHFVNLIEMSPAAQQQPKEQAQEPVVGHGS